MDISSSLSPAKPKARSASYWSKVDQVPLLCRLPIVTVAMTAACIGVYYGRDDHGWSYGPSNEGEWWSSLAAMISHVDQEHLWNNVVLLVVGGLFLELTEGIPHVLCAVYAAGVLSAALHGVCDPESRLRGTSGAIYGIIFSQLALLALNWREMPARLQRLLVLLFLIAFDVAIYWFWRSESISYEAHLFGAATGVCIALVLGRNVVLEKYEILLTWLGVLGYAALLTAAYVGGQYKAASLAAVVMLVLAVAAALITRLTLRQRRDSPGPQTENSFVVP